MTWKELFMSQYYNLYGHGVKLGEMRSRLERLKKRRTENWMFVQARLGTLPKEVLNHASCEEVQTFREAFEKLWNNSMVRAYGKGKII
tara:strand:- start:862 stop:1125 length:264 start_codon:yes stop_codon:yes gene_type:complete